MTERVRLGAFIGSAKADALVATVQRAEALGFDSVWTGEGYGGDAVVPMAWAAAHTSRIRIGSSILQMPARTPTMTAMTAMQLDRLSGGRLVLGLGTSGPQVVEGWHGQPFRPPLLYTREYLSVLRQLFAAEGTVRSDGRFIQIPYTGEGSTGQGKALRSAFRPRSIPILLAAIGPKNVALAIELADGLIPMLWNPYKAREVYSAAIDAAESGTFELAPSVPVALGDDLAACRDQVRPIIAQYIGGMGSRTTNFYNLAVRRYGFAEAAGAVQDAFLAGNRREAVSLVPDRLVDELTVVGPDGHVVDQLRAWLASGITTLVFQTSEPDTLTRLAELVGRAQGSTR